LSTDRLEIAYDPRLNGGAAEARFGDVEIPWL
jgi:hypothetical protein